MPKHPLTVPPKPSPTPREQAVDLVVPPSPQRSGFFSFRYSSTVVSSQGGRTHVKAKLVALEDGELRTESFEGELDARAHGDAIRHAQQQVFDDAAPLLQALRWLLPRR